MGIIADVQLTENRKIAALLLKKVIDLNGQKGTVNINLQALKTKISNDVPLNIWNKDDFVSAGKNLTMRELILAKLQNCKAELITIKSEVQNVDYENEIQAVIDTL